MLEIFALKTIATCFLLPNQTLKEWDDLCKPQFTQALCKGRSRAFSQLDRSRPSRYQ